MITREDGSMTQATLPESLESHTLDTMQTGDQAWTMPSAMWVDLERRCWLHPQYPARRQPGGTVEMLVVRTDRGYVVHVPDGATWQPELYPLYGDNVRSDAWLPVAELVEPPS
jgi:hypothetical protein